MNDGSENKDVWKYGTEHLPKKASRLNPMTQDDSR
jgi:hypothetical protein